MWNLLCAFCSRFQALERQGPICPLSKRVHTPICRQAGGWKQGCLALKTLCFSDTSRHVSRWATLYWKYWKGQRIERLFPRRMQPRIKQTLLFFSPYLQPQHVPETPHWCRRFNETVWDCGLGFLVIVWGLSGDCQVPARCTLCPVAQCVLHSTSLFQVSSSSPLVGVPAKGELDHSLSLNPSKPWFSLLQRG